MTAGRQQGIQRVGLRILRVLQQGLQPLMDRARDHVLAQPELPAPPIANCNNISALSALTSTLDIDPCQPAMGSKWPLAEPGFRLKVRHA
jgi:hypothetical protein